MQILAVNHTEMLELLPRYSHLEAIAACGSKRFSGECFRNNYAWLELFSSGKVLEYELHTVSFYWHKDFVELDFHESPKCWN